MTRYGSTNRADDSTVDADLDRHEDHYADDRLPGLGGFLGRGRVAMLVLMAFLAFNAYATNQRGSMARTDEYTTTTGGMPVVPPSSQLANHTTLSQMDREAHFGQQAGENIRTQHLGLLNNQTVQHRVSSIGERLVAQSRAKETPYQFSFYVLADDRAINVFALPGGQIYVTYGLLKQVRTDGELAAMLAHAIGHVVARHNIDQISRAVLPDGSVGQVVFSNYDPRNPTVETQTQYAQLVTHAAAISYDERQELASDRLALEFIAAAGYDPRSLISAVRALLTIHETQSPMEFFRMHPDHYGRIKELQVEIERLYPRGVP